MEKLFLLLVILPVLIVIAGAILEEMYKQERISGEAKTLIEFILLILMGTVAGLMFCAMVLYLK